MLRAHLYKQLDPRAYGTRGLSRLNKVILAVIIASVFIAIIGTERSIADAHASEFFIADCVFFVFFSLEYAARLWVVGENPEYAGWVGRMRYILSIPSLIDLAAILPFLFAFGASDAYLLRLFRLMRILSLAKLGRFSNALKIISMAIAKRRYALFMSLFAAMIVMLLSATVLYLAEGASNPESFGSIPRAMWWGVATMTKVGYGDAFPITAFGKICAAVFAVAAIGVIAMPTGILAAAFSEAFQRNQEAGD